MATSFLMFVGEQYGRAHQAIQFYRATFTDSQTDEIQCYLDDQAQAGKVRIARVGLNAKSLMAADVSGEHGFELTPARSLLVDCEDRAHQSNLFQHFAGGG
ncbi:hypothetical protein GCM10008090_04090 [Arenicella chitinivorans]|uniref:PhnB-like domain-containing protein n=1 Tax=Arenicella chitinivorans TaxID=1329800 RepID=A0A918VI83_9GAMM|nr:hypothetical protein GCM10008090_04090 [Arenicella chitinivorans]